MFKGFFSFLLCLIVFLTYTPAALASAAESDTPYTYEGEANEKGVYEGAGKLYYEGNLFYEGEFHNNLFEGEGTLYHVSSEGNLEQQNDIYVNEVKYKGQFKNGLYHGKGTLYYQVSTLTEQTNEGIQFDGKFQYGEYNGYGTLYNMDGSNNQQGYFLEGVLYKYEGPTDENGLMHGKGKLLNDSDKVIFEGNFEHGVISGMGTLYNDEHTWKYVGPFKNDVMDGQGKIYMNDKLYYSGSFKDGVKAGKGDLYLPNEKLAYSGEFVLDRATEQPFQVKAELALNKNGSATYNVYYVLLNKYKTDDMLAYFNELKASAKDKFDSVKDDTSNNEYISFKATKEIDDLTETYIDDFLGFNFVVNKTRLMVYEQFEVFGYLATSLDANLINVNYEVLLPEGAKNVNTESSSNVMVLDENRYAWSDITDNNYRFLQFERTNYLNVGILAAFIIVLLIGIFSLKKKPKNSKKSKKLPKE